MHKDFEIAVRNDEGKLGTLLISKENLEWLPKGNSVNKRRLSWKEFAEFMDQYGKPVISAGIYIVRLRNTGKRMSQFQAHGQMRRLRLIWILFPDQVSVYKTSTAGYKITIMYRYKKLYIYRFSMG